MKPENLIVLASARGMRLDLGRPKRDIPLKHRQAPKRRDVGRKGPNDPGIPGIQTADGKQSPSQRPPEWTATDLGFAAQGMPELWWRTLCWCLAEEERARMYLKWKLLEHALKLKEEEVWPKRFRRADCGTCGMMRCSHKYVEDLVQLALLEGAHPQMIGTSGARAAWFGLSEKHWRRSIMKGYHAVHGELDRWFRNAEHYLRNKLRERDDGAQGGTQDQQDIANVRP